MTYFWTPGIILGVISSIFMTKNRIKITNYNNLCYIFWSFRFWSISLNYYQGGALPWTLVKFNGCKKVNFSAFSFEIVPYCNDVVRLVTLAFTHQTSYSHQWLWTNVFYSKQWHKTTEKWTNFQFHLMVLVIQNYLINPCLC